MENDLKSAIMLDVRERVMFPPESIKEQWKTEYDKRHDIYLNFKAVTDPDAERWPDAIDSYKKYECFSNEHYSFNEEPILCFHKNGETVRIPADILTNVDTVHNMMEKHYPLKEEDEKVLQAFYRVSYTIGAFCPIWHNPSPGSGAYNDIVWNKLGLSGVFDEHGLVKKDFVTIDERDNVLNLRKRTNIDLFMILPREGNRSACDVMKKLYFSDHFDKDWNLICDVRTIRDKSLNDKNIAIEFVKTVTKLIIQRSYRIIKNCQEDEFSKDESTFLEEIFNEIGIGGECICCKKQLY